MASTTADPKPNNLTTYQKFLLKHRQFCEKCSIMTLTRAVDVIRENGHDIAVCSDHSDKPTTERQ